MYYRQEPQTYQSHIPSSLPKNDIFNKVANAVDVNETDPPCDIVFLTAAGESFRLIAKNRHWAEDFWIDLVGPHLKVGLDVETWRRGTVPDAEDSDKKHEVEDVLYINLSALKVNYEWHYTKDHAKWGVSETGDWICVADINRQISQEKRGGGTIWLRNPRECAILSWKLKRLPTPWFDDVGKNNIKPQEKGAEMGSLLRTAKKHKKSRRLGEPEVMAREEYGELEVDVKIEMIRSLIPLGLMHVHELLDDEVKELAGERYARKDELERGRRHGTNPGTVGLAGQRVPIRVPRVRSQEGVEIPLRSYEALNDGGEVNDLLLKRVLYGISCRNYEAAAEAIPGAIGLSSSTVSRGFVQASAAKLREMQERDLSGEDVVALFLDGKSFADAMMVIALGITLSGEKRFLGFVETDTENEKVLTPFLRSLLARGLDSSQGLLVIIDGGKSLKAAVKKAFRKRVLIQRCQWHKRENVVSYLSKGEQASLRKRLQSAYNRPEYKEALAALDQLHDELEERNQSAAGSLEEGIEETLTLHRLGVYGALGRSFKTTNCLESVNALVEERCAKVDHWKNSSQRQRWLATALVDIEPRLRRVIGYRHLPKLREALKRELKIETKTSTVSKKKAA